jgi:hypothetical protein
MAVDIKSLKLGEMKFFEQTTGMALSDLGKEGQALSAALAVLVYIFKRRQNPEYTLLDAEELTAQEATDFLGLGEEPEEDSPEGKEESSLKKPRAQKRTS